MVNQTAPATQAVQAVFVDKPATYQKGSGRAIRVALEGTLPSDAVIIALDWSDAQSSMQDAFATWIDPNRMVIPSERLDLLPLGGNELQLIVYSRSKGGLSKVVHRLVVEAAADAPPVLRNFTFGFGAAPANYQIGSGQAINLDVNGELPGTGDLLIMAWSNTERRMVDEFAFVLRQGPWTIPADRLAMLPAGQVELQLAYREGNKIKSIKKHAIQISYRIPSASIQNLPASFITGQAPSVGFTLDGPAPAGFEMTATVEPVSTGVTGFSQTLNSASPALGSGQLNALKPGDYRLALVTRYNNSEVARVTQGFRVERAPVAPTAGFAASAPAELLLGSAPSMNYVIGGDVTDSHELVVQAWSVAQNKAVEDFAYRTTPTSGTIPAARLERLPAGEVLLQLVLRKDQSVVATADHRMMVAQPTPEPATPTEPVAETDPVEPAVFSGQFVGAPSTYDLSVKPTISLAISNRPAGKHVDAIIQVWSIDQNRLVDSAIHVLSDKTGWTLDPSKLGTMPTGRVELQALIRTDYVIQNRVIRQMTVSVPVVSNPQPADETIPETNPEQPTQEPQPTDEPEPTVPPTQPEAPTEDPADQPIDETTPDPTVEPDLGSVTTSFTNLTPDADAIRIAFNADRAAIQAALDSGKDVLFPAGAVYTLSDLSIKSGGTVSNTRIIGVYGEGARPQFRSDGTAMTGLGKTLSHLAIVGLDFYAYKRDYTASTYDRTRDGQSPYGLYLTTTGNSENIRIEDCKFSYFYQNVAIHGVNSQEEMPKGLVIHRCIIAYAWSSSDRGVGLYSNTPLSGQGLTLTDTVFYHNGWRPGGNRTTQSHNIYIDDTRQRFGTRVPGSPVTVKGVLSIAGASHGGKFHPGGLIEDSIFARNAIAFFVSGNDSTVRRSVILQSTDLVNSGDDPRGFGAESFQMARSTWEDNVFAFRDSKWPWGYAIKSQSAQSVLRRNTIWNWKSGEGQYIQATGQVIEDTANITNASNRPLVDPTRDLGSYGRSIGLSGEAELIKQMLGRPRGVWHDKLAAPTIIRYIRNGFEPLPYD